MLVDDSAGHVSLYKGFGDGYFDYVRQIATGWWQYDQVVAHGDFSGDKIADVLTREAQTGDLYMNAGTGNASTLLAGRVLLHKAWGGYNALIAIGDVTGDRHPDLLAQVPSGTLYLFSGTRTLASGGFAAPTVIGTGYQQYNLFG